MFISANLQTTNHYHWIHFRKMSKKIIVYPVLVGSICNVPFKRLNQRDFIDLCTTDYTINSRNSNVGALMEIRNDDRMLGNIDPDTGCWAI